MGKGLAAAVPLKLEMAKSRSLPLSSGATVLVLPTYFANFSTETISKLEMQTEPSHKGAGE